MSITAIEANEVNSEGETSVSVSCSGMPLKISGLAIVPLRKFTSIVEKPSHAESVHHRGIMLVICRSLRSGGA